MSDYDRIAQAIAYISSRVNEQPELAEIAAHLHMSPFHFQRMFSRWAGVTPKRYLQILTLAHAKQLLDESRSVLEVADTLGLSSGSRLYDHFVQLEAVTPGEFKLRGAGLAIEYGVHETPFGLAFLAATPRGICKFVFVNNRDIQAPLAELSEQWPRADLGENQSLAIKTIERIFSHQKPVDRPLSLYVTGTNFQINVWKALMQIPAGKVASYANIASAIGRPTAARAVGLAAGANPVAFLIPCHRVIQQSGKLGGYHWGLTRKHAIHAWETAQMQEYAVES